MTDPITTAIVVKTAEVLAKDAYQDGAQPAVREVGKTLALPLRMLNVALGPLRIAAAAGEKYWQDLEARVTSRIPGEKIVEPAPAIAGPLLLYYPFVESEPSLRDLFEQLLASAMHADLKNLVHPSFGEVLRQLGTDDAIILRGLSLSVVVRGARSSRSFALP